MANFFKCWRLPIGCSALSTNQKSPKRQKYDLTSFLKIPQPKPYFMTLPQIYYKKIFLPESKDAADIHQRWLVFFALWQRVSGWNPWPIPKFVKRILHQIRNHKPPVISRKNFWLLFLCEFFFVFLKIIFSFIFWLTMLA